MDPLIHCLWTYLLYRQQKKPVRYRALFFSLFADIPVMISLLYSIIVSLYYTTHFSQLRMTYIFYSYTHSIVFFIPVFLLLWIILRRIPIELGAWGLHIITDVIGHMDNATSFLFPISSYQFHSFFSWEWIGVIVGNYLCLGLAYTLVRKRELKEQVLVN